MSLLSSSAKEYNVNDSACLFSLLAKSSLISSTQQVAVQCDKLIFFYLFLLLGHRIADVSTMHFLRNLPSEKGVLVFANLNATK